MPRTTEQHAAQMRRRILEGAERAFQATGYRSASVPDIAAEADVSVGLIYRYFESKQELFLAVCQAATEQKLDELAVALSEISDPAERIRVAVRLFVRSFVDEGWGAIIVQAWAEAENQPRLRDMLQRLTEQQRTFAAMFMREAIARREASAELDVGAFSLAVSMLLSGTIARQAEYGERFDPDAVEEAIIAVLSAPLGS
jgi:AcrR family transcriptional regulator